MHQIPDTLLVGVQYLDITSLHFQQDLELDQSAQDLLYLWLKWKLFKQKKYF